MLSDNQIREIAKRYENPAGIVSPLEFARAVEQAAEARADAALNAQIEAEACFATLALGKNLAEVRAEVAEAERDALRRALAELVAVADMTAKVERLYDAILLDDGGEPFREWNEALGELMDRRPLAWESARAALSASPPTCGNGCLCLTVCGDYYEHAGLPRPKDMDGASPPPVGSGEPK